MFSTTYGSFCLKVTVFDSGQTSVWYDTPTGNGRNLIVFCVNPGLHDEEKMCDNYKDFCDFGGGHFSALVKEHPELETEEFRMFLTCHNRGDRDSGELNDIAKEEIDRLARAFIAMR